MDIKKIVNNIEKLDFNDFQRSNKYKIISGRARKITVALFRYFILLGLAFIILYPLIYMLSVSFRHPNELMDPTVVWIPKTFTFSNITTVFGMLDYPTSLMRTLFLTLLCSILQVFTCSLTGYGFARFKFRLRNILFFAALFTLIVPPQAIMMPLYINFVNFTEYTKNFFSDGIKLIDTPFPMAFSAFFGLGIRAGLFIYIFRQYYKNLPPELEDAAYIDGCDPIKAYWKIMFVNTGPVLLVSFLFSFVWYWNDYFYVSLYFTNARPLAVLVANFTSVLNTTRLADGSPLSISQISVYVQVSSLMFIGPVLLMYVFLQKYFTQSIVRAGIVG